MRGLGTMGIPSDTNGTHDLFLRDRWAGTTQRANLTSFAGQGNLSVDGSGSMSAYAETVAFSTYSPMTSDDTNLLGDVFVRELGKLGPRLSLTPVISGFPATFTLTGATPTGLLFVAWNLAGQGELPSPWDWPAGRSGSRPPTPPWAISRTQWLRSFSSASSAVQSPTTDLPGLARPS